MGTIGERIREIRKVNHLTQEEFSDILGVKQPHISNIERGKDFPSKTLVVLISILFETDRDWLLHGQKMG